MPNTTRSLLVIGILAGMAGCGGSESENQLSASSTPDPSMEQPIAAMATLIPVSGSTVSGEVRFYPMNDALMVEVTAMGLEPGSHGFHIHAVGDCSAPDASSAGDHFAPNGNAHGAPAAPSDQHHAGDLGNIEASVTGVAQYQRSTSSLSLAGPDSVIGKAVIIHAGEDDLRTQPSGNSGDRIACGVIAVVTEFPDEAIRVDSL